MLLLHVHLQIDNDYKLIASRLPSRDAYPFFNRSFASYNQFLSKNSGRKLRNNASSRSNNSANCSRVRARSPLHLSQHFPGPGILILWSVASSGFGLESDAAECLLAGTVPRLRIYRSRPTGAGSELGPERFHERRVQPRNMSAMRNYSGPCLPRQHGFFSLNRLSSPHSGNKTDVKLKKNQCLYGYCILKRSCA